MLQRILDNIEAILVELRDNNINFEFDVKDKRLNMFRMDINLRKSISQYDGDGSPSWYLQEWSQNRFDPKYFFDENGKMFNYISEALLTLDAYLKRIGMNVKVHYRKDYRNGFSITMKEFTEIDPEGLYVVIIGIDKDHRTPKLEKRIYSYSQFINEELKDITTNVSGSGRSREVAKIYNDEDAYIKSPAAGILLNNKFRREEMDSIITALQQGAKPEEFSIEDPKLLRILVLANNLKFLKDKLKEKGRLQCEYCGKGPLIIYDVAPDKFSNLIDNPYYRLNQDFDAEWGATCDHKDPQSLGGDKFDYSNLAVCCYRCNQRKRSMPYKQWMERIGKTNESLVVPRQPIDQMADTFIVEVFDKFDIDYCEPEDEEKMDDSRKTYWTFLFEDRDGKGGLLETPYEQFLEICWLESELYTNVMNELLAVKSMVERRTGYTYKLKHITSWGYGFITIDTRDIYGNFLRPEE
jgi:hypothetical protein